MAPGGVLKRRYTGGVTTASVAGLACGGLVKSGREGSGVIESWDSAVAPVKKRPGRPVLNPAAVPGTGEASPVGPNASVWEKLEAEARGRKATKVVIHEWVADHMTIDPLLIAPQDVPSPGAISFLRWARENPERFYKEFFGKTGAGKQPQQADGRLTEDGRSIEEILLQFERAVAEYDAGVAGESG